MKNDAKAPLAKLKVDGGVTNSSLMLQIQVKLKGTREKKLNYNLG